MSTSNVKAAVRNFICRESAGVLALVGDWGVGKTYFWNSEVKALGTSLACKKYAYVSLFGVLNLTEVKDLIFQRTVPTDELKNPVSVETAGRNTEKLAERFGVLTDQAKRGARKHLDIIKSIPKLAEFGRVMSSLAFFSIRDTLICIDDIERASSTLAVEEVLGLISQLKEERNCQVVLLLNRDAMHDKVADAYAAYRDKVIDVEVEFAPDTAECVDLVVAVDHPYHEWIKNDAVRLNITNMRVLQRCVRMLDELRPLIDSTEESLQRHVVHSMVLFCWMWFHRREGVPSLDELLAPDYSPWVLVTANRHGQELPPEKRLLHETLKAYEFFGISGLSHLDRSLAEYVRLGYIDAEVMQRGIAESNGEAKATGGKQAFNAAFRWYLDSFDDNEDEGIAEFQRLWHEHGPYLSAGDLQQTMNIFRGLMRNEEADVLVDRFIEVHQGTPTVFNLKKYSGIIDLTDPYLRQRFDEAYAENHVDNTEIREVISEIVTRRAWGPEQTAFLAKHSADDFYNMLKTSRTPELYSWIRQLLGFGHGENASEEYLCIARNTIEALRRIAKESHLNRMRVARHGIDLDDVP